MFQARDFFAEINQTVAESYTQSLKKIQAIVAETKDFEQQNQHANVWKFFHITGQWILKLTQLEKELDDAYFQTKSLEELQVLNRELFFDVQPENYETAYTNPAYATAQLGKDLGPLLASFAQDVRQYITYAFEHRIYNMNTYNQIFIQAFEALKAGDVSYEKMNPIITASIRERSEEDYHWGMKTAYSPDFRYFIDIIENADLNDLRYLYRYASHVTEYEIRTAEFLRNYPQEKIETLSQMMVKAYVRSFELDEKDLSKKSTVRIIGCAGQERIIRQLIKDFAKQGLKPLISSMQTKPANRQYGYDHRFDNALYLDEAHVERSLKQNKIAYESVKGLLSQVSGPVVFETFGEKPFAPKNKPEALKLSQDQQMLMRKLQSEFTQLHYGYMPRGETSFSIIAFPSPEIGDQFEAIFQDTMEINMLDTEHYEPIQEHIISVLDQADYVHIKGKDGNRTDLQVKMQPLADPTQHTNFVNCGADVNIPLGEVFTSPQLKGTNGILHVQETYLRDLKYVDLELEFKDGYVGEYSCKNFDKDEDNQKYIQENLLFPHKTLPLGEFAIGTNTLAYVVAQKYDIMHLLPILIIEKMGPHFAVGDTCFSHEEDRKATNPVSGKEITAKDNEHSAVRKTDMQKAYTGCHTDITLPYEGIEFIAAVTKDGKKIDIIRDGRFVVPGTEELNKPFENEI